MIPKIIHYTWFSDEPFSESIESCLQTWRKHLSDYDFVLWDIKKIKNIDNKFLDQALSEKKWAFASDYVRLYAVYHYGGIYLDTDVKVVKNFDGLLKNTCFIGRESSFHLVGKEVVSFLTSHCFGAEAQNKFIEDCLLYYDDRNFISSTNQNLPRSLRLNMTLLPYIQAEIAVNKGWNWNYFSDSEYMTDEMIIYPANYFDGTEEGKLNYCFHLALGSWRERRKNDSKITFLYKIKWRIVKLFEFCLKKLGYVVLKVN